MLELSPVVTRVDQRNGFWEEASFLQVDGDNLFAVTHAPVAHADTGLVICCSILVEQMTNYRHEVLLARAMAARGVAVQRFHYRGTGHSTGDEEDTSLQTMVDDALLAAERLAARTNPRRLAFFGIRWGGLVAGLAAQRYPGSLLLLWEPVADASRYFREVIRSRLVRELKDDRFGGGSPALLMEDFERTGQLDILGYTLSRKLYDSAQGTRLDAVLAGRSTPVLLVQFGRGGVLRPDYDRLRSGLGTPHLFAAQFIDEEPSWFSPGYRIRAARELIAGTTDWITRSINEEGS